MKLSCSVIVILAAAILSFGQRAQNNTDEQLAARNAPDLFVQKASAYGPDKEKRSNFTIEVKNTGSKTVTAVEWVYDPPEEGGAGRQLKARNQVRIPAGEERKMDMAFSYYSEKFVAGFRLNRIRVTRVDYEDGSSWRRPDAAKPDGKNL